MGHSRGFIKLKKEIKGLTDYKRGYFHDFYKGYIHGIHDHHKYGDITGEEGMELEELFKLKK